MFISLMRGMNIFNCCGVSQLLLVLRQHQDLVHIVHHRMGLQLLSVAIQDCIFPSTFSLLSQQMASIVSADKECLKES